MLENLSSMTTGQRKQHKSDRFSCKTTTLQVYHTFLYISLASLHDYNVKRPNWMRRLRRIFLFHRELVHSSLECKCRKICRYLTNWASGNNRRKWRFRCWFPLLRNFSVRTHVNFTRVNIIEAMYKRPRVNGKVERGSTFTFTLDLPYMPCILFTRLKFSAYARKNYATGEIHP